MGLVTLGRKQHEVFLGHDIVEDRNYSEEIAHTIDIEIRAIVDESMYKAKEILTENRDRLEEITRLLLEKEVIEGDELDELLGYPKKERAPENSESTEGVQNADAASDSQSESGEPDAEAVLEEVPDIEQVDQRKIDSPLDADEEKN